MSVEEEEATISYPSIAIVLGLAYLLYRYFSSSSAGNASSSSSSSAQSRNERNQRYTEAQLDTVCGMFPQLSRRDIAWDLHRNRGNVDGTVERLLAGGGRSLDHAPPSFQLPTPNTSQPASTTPSAFSSLLSGTRKVEPDLITRYKLHDRINSSDKGKAPERDGAQGTGQTGLASGATGTWAATKAERQETLRQRRDQMILEARRKMLERDALA